MFTISAGRWWWRYDPDREEYRAGLVSGARIFLVERPLGPNAYADTGEYRGTLFFPPRYLPPKLPYQYLDRIILRQIQMGSCDLPVTSSHHTITY